jgi:hypothetical protein
MKTAIINSFTTKMLILRVLTGLYFFLTSLVCFADQNPPQKETPKAKASLEIGADSYERRYVRPYLRFEFPFRKGFLFTEVDYYQRINSQLKGEVDFWLKAGLQYEFTPALSLEGSLNHFCRHITSRSYPIIFDVNEVLGRLWYRSHTIKLGFGGGIYIGGNENYDNLLVFNFKYPEILQSEFGIDVELKLVTFTQVLHDMEFFISLNENLDLFVRNTNHYEYNNTTYLGVRFKSGGPADKIIRKLRFQTGIITSYELHKMESILAFDLEFFKRPHRRLQISLNSRIPILRDDSFLHVFRPEVIEYPLSIQYERKINKDLFAVGYGLYDVVMPVDVDQRFRSSLGVGVGLRNQPFFEKLEKTVRFEVFGGHNFTHTYDAGARLGFNTVGKSLNFGVDADTMFNPEEFDGSLTLFGEFGKEIKVRIFVSGETTQYFDADLSSVNKWQFGISLFSWF